MSSLLQDVHFALRQLRRRPGFTLSVVFVLALGMGAGAAMFSVLRGTLLQPLPYRDPGTLVSLQPYADDARTTSASVADVEVWQKRTHTLSSIAYYSDENGFLSVGHGDQRVSTPGTSANLFQTLGIAPALGRSFSYQEQVTGAPVIVLDDTLWRNLFGGRSDALGKTVLLNGRMRTVIGVMPPGFSFPANPSVPQAWVPAAADAKAHQRDFYSGSMDAHFVGRRSHGATNTEISEELTSIQKQLRPLYAGDLALALAPGSVRAMALRETLDKQARPALQAITAAVAVLWLIACASAAGLLLARGAARAQEFAVRGALGASRFRVLRQLLTESLVLAVAAALCGLGFASVLLAGSNRVLQRQLHHPVMQTASAPVLFAMVALVLATATLFGSLPAWLASRGTQDGNLRERSTRTGTSRNQVRLQQALIVAELALTVTLLVACGLLLRTVFALRRVPLGFRTDHVLVAELQLPAYRYADQDLLRTVYRPLLEKAEHLPGVDTASLSTMVPLSGDFDMTYGMFVNRSKGTKPEESYLKLRMVTPELQKVLGFRMLKGRYLSSSDTPQSQPVAVVNKAFADRYDRDGKDWAANTLSFGDVHIVGVMENFRQTSMGERAIPELQLSANQLSRDSKVPFTGVYQTLMQAHVELAVRTHTDPLTLRSELERLLRSTDPALGSSTLRSMDQIVDDSIGSQLIASRLLLAFASLALLVALAGLYSLLSFSVTVRTRELGVRLALGAQRFQVLLLVLRGAGLLLAAGTLLGVALSAASAHLLRSFLFSTQRNDVSTTACAAALLLLCGSIAAFVPAYRAAGTDPMNALRTE